MTRHGRDAGHREPTARLRVHMRRSLPALAPTLAAAALATACADDPASPPEAAAPETLGYVAQPDRDILVALYNATDGPNWVDDTNWLSDEPLGEWYGVGTDAAGRVVALDLSGRWDNDAREYVPHGLTGAIPADLGGLTALRTLNLSVNELSGSIPAELGNLSNLRYLYLQSNELTGAIPRELDGLSNLWGLYLSSNELTGPIPPELGTLSNLQYLNLSGNELTGPIPPELGSLSNLGSLYLSHNGLTGAIPPELGGLSSLVALWLNNNGFLRGSLPLWLLDLENLASLVYSDTRICVPENVEMAAWLEGLQDHRGTGVDCVAHDRAALVALYRAADGPNWADNTNWLTDAPLGEWYGVETDSAGQVARVDLSGRRDEATGEWVPHGLNGAVPTALAGLSSVASLDLSVNRLEGAVPPELGGVTSLESLWLDDNGGLWGTLPASLLDLENLLHFGYSGTRLCVPDPEMAAWLEGLETHRGSGVDCAANDRTVLETLYETTDGPHWVNADNWLTDAPLAEWYGVETDSAGRVVGLDLTGRLDEATGEWEPHGLSGPVPPELGVLERLDSLDLSVNRLTGAIPAELGSLSDLRFLSLSVNRLVGGIPAELGRLSQLESLWLEDNERLRGSLPGWLLSLPGLAHFGYSGTGICVPGDAGIEAWLGGLETHSGSGVDCVANDRAALEALYHATDGPNWVDNTNWLADAPLGEWHGVDTDASGRVVALDLSGRWDYDAREYVPHGLTGAIPAELGDLAAVRTLRLSVNELSGSIPQDLGGLSNLGYLYLDNNRLSGAIPAELGSLSNLQYLQLHSNELTGAIPAELGGLAALRTLRLSANELSGSIPPELGGLSNLQYLYLHSNELTGAIPAELGGLSGLVALWLADNGRLRGSLPLWLLDLENLVSLGYAGTRICVPDNAEVAAWLEGLETHRGTGLDCVTNDRAALVALYRATDGPNWADNTNWLTEAPLGEWYGIETDSAGQVARVDLSGRRDDVTGEWVAHGLNGSVPAALAGLSRVESLDLSVNWLSGAIPPELGGLSGLRDLSLSVNQLEGAIPPELGGLSNLGSLWLEDNQGLWGTLPVSLLDLENLLHFGYAGTRLCVPDNPELAVWLEGLETHRGSGVDCATNDRTVLEALYEATDGPNWVNADNWLTDAPLAEWYGVETDSAGRVVGLDLSGRLDDGTGEWEPHGLSGPVPPELDVLERLDSLDLSVNRLTGAIPAELGSLADLRFLSLARNRLTGAIPEELGRLSQLESLWLEDNEGLRGSVPLWLRDLRNLAHFGYSGTGICVPDDAGIVAWLGDLDTHRGSGVDCLANDRAALEALYHATDGPNWVDNTNWLTDAPLGEWYGVGAGSSGRVVALNLSGRWDSDAREWVPHGLTGAIPAGLGGLAALRTLNLSVNELSGSIPPELGGLSNLWYLYLYNNRLTSAIPAGLGGLAALRTLNLSVNELSGSIPPELGGLSNLQHLHLQSNDLSGPIPPELGGLSNLQHLYLQSNDLSGPIPPELGGPSNLQYLDLDSNDLSGPIPPELGSLSSLQALSLFSNDLSGPIPPELGNLSDLRHLDLHSNDLSGPIPPELGGLSNLRLLSVAPNELTGPIPATALALSLRSFTWAGRHWLTGEWTSGLCAPGTSAFVEWLDSVEVWSGPFCNESDEATLTSFFEFTDGPQWTQSQGWLAGPALGEWHGVETDSLGRVTALALGDNGLSGGLPGSLSFLTQLGHLRIDGNALGGRLPLMLTALDLETLHYDDTELCEPADARFRDWLEGIPSHRGTAIECPPLTDRDALIALYNGTDGPNWAYNTNWLTDAPLDQWQGVRVDSQDRVILLNLAWGGNLSGAIPPELGALSNLEYLWLQANNLTGPIPPELGDLARLRQLYLFYNDLTGAIPPELGNLAGLRRMNLWWNDLSGPIPPELGALSNLEELGLGGNALTAGIPPELGRLPSLETLDLGPNELSGAIPPELGELASLERLLLRHNSITGLIPPELGSLTNLSYLNLRDNDLSGPIPPELGALENLSSLYLQANSFTGSIPPELGSLANLARLHLTANDFSGRVPSTFGGLSRLTELELSHNPELAGAMPTELTDLELEALLASGTELCVQRGSSFEDWLAAIPRRRIALCGEPPAAYLVQSVQSRAHPVPLVAGEEALLRVFVTAAQETTAGIPEVRARFYLNGTERHVADIPAGSTPISTEIDEGDLSKSVNAEIPGWVVRPGLEMVVEIDPEGMLDESLAVPERIPLEGRLAVEVHELPVLDLTVIPFLWSPDPDSAIIGLVDGMAADPDGHALLEETHVLLPVGGLDVTPHAPVASTSNHSHDLLAQTEAIRVLEGGGGHFIGMMSGAVTGAGGVADLPGRSNFSRPYSGTIAHELGHNMSLRHAPCGGASGPDPSFPDPRGAIGTWGYDFDRASLVPATRKDHMSYCDPTWTSDYHFTNALRHRLADEGGQATGLADATTTSLLLWGGVDTTGTPFLNPVFVADAPPALPDSAGDYAVTGRDADGRELFSLSFPMSVALAEEEEVASFVFALPARPGWEDALASVTLSGPDGAATLDGDSDMPMAILRDAATGRVRGFLRDMRDPAAARAAAGALGVPTSGVNVLFSRGIPDEAVWR